MAVSLSAASTQVVPNGGKRKEEGEIVTFFNTEFSQPVVTGASLLFLGPLPCGWFLKVTISPYFFLP